VKIVEEEIGTGLQRSDIETDLAASGDDLLSFKVVAFESFLPHDIPLLLQRRVALDSSAVHLQPAIFPISAVRHDCLLLGWCGLLMP
jgi:hypothetical protein